MAAKGTKTRPLKYTLADIKAAGELYFASRVAADGSGTKPLTMTGLALGLGMCSRQMLLEYAGRDDEIGDTVKQFIGRVTEYVEARLMGTAATGAIFWLKNHGWRDEQKIDHTSKGEEIKSIQYINPPATQVITAPAHGDPTTQANGQATPGLPSVGTA